LIWRTPKNLATLAGQCHQINSKKEEKVQKNKKFSVQQSGIAKQSPNFAEKVNNS
jgi:hypothetical protein